MKVWRMLSHLRFDHFVSERAPGHVHLEDLERYTLGKTEGEEKTGIASHIRQCEICRVRLNDAREFASDFQAMVTPSRSEERRKEKRYEVMEPARIKVLQPAEFVAVPCTVIDVSSSGLRISSPRPLIQGAYVDVQVELAAIFGRIRHCRANGRDGFDVGIEIDQVELYPLTAKPVDSAARFEDEGRQTSASQGAGAQKMPTPLEVLLVEDNQADVTLAQSLLEETGVPFHLTVVRDGQQALERLLDKAQSQPGLVLLDLGLPKINGFEVLTRLRNEQTLQSLSVVVFSGSFNESDARRSRELGVRAYLQKPVDYHFRIDVGQQIKALMTR